MKRKGLAVVRVEPGSIAGEPGLEPGDRVIAINGEPVRDLIDYRFFETEESLYIEVKKAGGEDWDLDVEKDFDQGLGIDFGSGAFGRTCCCSNKCVFCFVDQMPPGMRKTLYEKDDDYRLSFWSGNYITLTNLSEADLRRITTQRLSPLYVSVHTTNPVLRERMLGNIRAGLILEQLRFLAAARIEMHTQVVLCPGLNDGRELEKTLDDLSSLWPSVRSLAVVPVGLTRYRQALHPLRTFKAEEAGKLLYWVNSRQDEFISKFGDPFIFASDEFYLLSGEPIPPDDNYAGYPQLENGVGVTRLFLDQWEEVRSKLPRASRRGSLKAKIVTAALGAKILGPVVSRLNEVKGLEVSLKTIQNHFFGNQVTVAGLVTGGDLASQLTTGETGDLLVIPSVMLKKDSAVFLDGLTLEELAGRLKARVAVVNGPRRLVEVLLGNLKNADILIDSRS